MEDAKKLQSGTSLAEINRVLGQSHAPTAMQADTIESTIAHMPPPMQANAAKDRRFAWGTDDGFLVAVVNDQDVAWVISWHSGSPPPTRPTGMHHP